MRQVLIKLVVAVFAVMLAKPSFAAADTEQSACGLLVHLGSVHHLAGKNATGNYKCQLHLAEKKYFVFALKYSGREVVEGSSNLVGYYLVESGSGSIYEWDLGQGKRIGQVLGLETKRMTWKGS